MNTAAHPPVPDPQRDLLALGDDHARALALAAQRPTEPPGPIDEAWLTGHLAACAACSATTAAYEADRALLRALRDRAPSPPRDLWARTAAALDRERERSARDRRASPPSRPASPARRHAWSPAIVSGMLVVALIAGSSLLGGLGRALFPVPSGGASGPAASAIAVLADVRWIQSGTDGSFDVYLTQVDEVCPAGDSTACGPLHGVARTSIALGAAPRSISLSPDSAQLVVVASNGGTGGSVFVVSVPAASRPSASPSLASVAPGTVATPVVGASFLPGASFVPGASASGRPTDASPAPGGTATTIAEAVIVVGGTAAHSPDGAWFAFAARPSDGSTGPDIYVWRVGDAKARPITTDHRSIFSGWLGSRILGSRIDAVPATAGASPAPGASRAPGSSPAMAQPPGTPAPGASPTAAGTVSPTARPVPTPSPLVTSTPTGLAGPPASPIASAKASGSPAPSAAASSAPSVRPGFVIAREVGVTSFLLDPETSQAQDLPDGRFLRPIVDPTGAWVLYWDGTVVADAQGVDWMPGTGRLIVAPWASALPIVTLPGASASPGASPSPGPSAGPGTSAGPVGSGRLPAASAAPASTARPTAAPSPIHSAVALSSAAPTRPADGFGSAPAASLDPTGSAAPSKAPAPAGPQGLVDGPLVDFDAAFDPSGTHLAVWIANPVEPSIGSLTLYMLADGAWQLDPLHQLVGVPALRGFAIGASELVWVTPADAAGQGSRIEVVGWTKDGFGSVRSVPGGRLIVIR